MTKKKNQANPIGLDDHPDQYPNIIDELLKIARAEGPDAHEAFLKSEVFELGTRHDPRYHPELAHENSDPKERS